MPTCVTIREPSVDIAIRMKKEGFGPDRILMMVSTDPRSTTSPTWHDALPVLERGGALHQEGDGCGHQDVRHRLDDLGQPDQRGDEARGRRGASAGSRSAPMTSSTPTTTARPTGPTCTGTSRWFDAMPNPEAHLCHLHETKRIASRADPGGAAGGSVPLRRDDGRHGRSAGQLPG